MPLSIAQVLLFRDPKLSQELGPVLWAAFKEVETFWNTGEQRILVERRYVADEIPFGIARELGGWLSPALLSRLTRGLFGQAPDSPIGDAHRVLSQSRGRLAKTYDFKKIATAIREEMPLNADIYVIVMDQELTPPPEWRYIIWNGDNRDVVVSTAPVDPRYWRASDSDRVATVKHRVRTACLSAIGAFLGLTGCDNPRCVLFKDVDSVARLDAMVQLGVEHQITSLAGKGFDVLGKNLERPQSLKENPGPAEEGLSFA